MRGQIVRVSLPAPMLLEMSREAERQSRSLCAMVRLVWLVARKRIRAIPAPHAVNH